MTKKRLRAFRELKKEQKQLEDLLAHGETAALRQCYQAKLARVEQEQLAIEQAIDSLDTVQRTLMRHYYIEGLTWEEVCVKASYSWRQTHRIHAKALDQLEEAKPGA